VKAFAKKQSTYFKKLQKGKKFLKKKNIGKGNFLFYNLNPIGEAVLSNVFQNGSNSTREATPP
jgi:hypothetical protein